MNVLVFGATGSAGGSVLEACLGAASVREVRSITRRAIESESPKLRPYVHSDFVNYDTVQDAFRDLDACFFCLGVSVTQVPDEAEYRRITVDYAVAAAGALQRDSPSALFHFLSGAGTRVDGRYMWARVKGQAVCWRPAFIDGAVSSTGVWYNGALRPLFRLLKPFKSMYVSGDDLGRAMLQATREGMTRRVIENAEIRELAARWNGDRT